MEESMYGRMMQGRCTEKDLGYVGCGSDVLATTDQMCSGRQHCSIRVSDELQVAGQDADPWACHDVSGKQYLWTGYSCVKAD